ncbi:hypothetical protein WYO_0198 [Methylobacterium sp. GXF4]|nr:hypothetical protein WYO_0198 [Methylobacterium sp. GXF4]
MQDHKVSADPLEMWGQQVLRVQTAALALSDHLVLLGLVAQTAWLGLLVPPDLKELPAQRARRDQRARTARLVRRGIPEPLARQGLKVL